MLCQGVTACGMLCAQDVVSDVVDVASDKVVDYGSTALSKADEATSVAARATANKVAEVRARAARPLHGQAGLLQCTSAPGAPLL